MAQPNENTGRTFWQTVMLVFDKIAYFFGGIGHVFKIIWTIIVRLRKIILAAPVIVVALDLAKQCSEALAGPFRFHIMDLIASFKHSEMVIRQVEVSRDMAIIGPLAVTGTCLVLMFLSRRTVYPWLISIFSLVIPLYVLFAGYLPA